LPAKSFSQDSLAKGLMAFDGKDYATAVRLVTPYAQQGHCLAQFVLGYAYQYGLSVEKSDSIGRYWLERAAEQKQPAAMGPLAVNYFSTGSGNSEHLIRAYLWAMLAAEYEPAQLVTSARHVIRGYMSPEQLKAAEDRIRQYKTAWADKPSCR
jgi:TPR repeat protein